jgi:hypothetical protein
LKYLRVDMMAECLRDRVLGHYMLTTVGDRFC